MEFADSMTATDAALYFPLLALANVLGFVVTRYYGMVFPSARLFTEVAALGAVLPFVNMNEQLMSNIAGMCLGFPLLPLTWLCIDKAMTLRGYKSEFESPRDGVRREELRRLDALDRLTRTYAPGGSDGIRK